MAGILPQSPWSQNIFLVRLLREGKFLPLFADFMIKYFQPARPMDTKKLKKLADQYSPKQLEACIFQQLSKGKNECEIVDDSDEVITALSKAEVVRELMDQGKTFSEALRELARRIRAVYGKEE
jgi:hypothetical protein